MTLKILLVIYVSFLSFFLFIAALWSPAGQGWPFDSLVCDVFLCFCHFPMWFPGPGVALDFIDS